MRVRIGHGYDVHRLVEGRPLLLAGVAIPYERGLDGHSDGDAVLHAVCDALLGAAGKGDIGAHFPDDDARFRGAASAVFVEHVMSLVRVEGWTVGNADVTIHAERPKMALHTAAMRARLAALLEVEAAAVNVKAKTNEGLDAIGRGEAIAATAVVLLIGQ